MVVGFCILLREYGLFVVGYVMKELKFLYIKGCVLILFFRMVVFYVWENL